MDPLTETYYDEVEKVWYGPKRKDFYGPDMTLGEVALSVLSLIPDKVVQITDPTGETLTAMELISNSKMVAKNLLEFGLKVGDIVGIVANNTKHLSSVMLGAFLCGTPTNALYPNFDKESIKILFAVTLPKIVFCEASNYATTRAACADLNLNSEIVLLNGDINDVRNVSEFFDNCGDNLDNMEKVAQSVGDIIVQLDVFDEQRECDEAQSLQGPNGINLNSHLDVFYAILRRVADTPQEVPFLSILQHLLRIDPKEPVSDVIWDTTEKVVHRATLLESHEDALRLLRTPSVQKFICPHCRGDSTSPTRKPSVVPASPNTSGLSKTGTLPAVPPPPPPPAMPNAVGAAPLPPSKHGGVPPPPPPPFMNNGTNSNAPAPPPIPSAPPPPGPNNLLSANSAHPTRPTTPDPGFNNYAAILLPQQDTPAPKAKMKTINWGKIPPNKVIGKQNIWTIVANNHQHSPMADIDWNEMEGLFCLQSTSAQGSPKLGREGNSNSGYDTLDRKSKKETTEISLLDGKRSLNVNIFLKQFRTSNEDIIKLIQNGEHDDIGAEKLRGLLKILPEVDELDMLKTFNGDKNRLGNAEKFLLQLLDIPNYKLRIECMLLKEEFAANIDYLDPCINAMIYAGDDLINNKMLQEVLYMVVVAGNFLNSGGYAGNAAGVKLSSLQKLTDIRANKPGINLIHFVAMQAEKRNPDLLKFTTQLNELDNASKTTSEQINNEIHTLDARIRKIKRQIEQPATDADIKEQMWKFLQSAEGKVAVLQAGMKEVEAMRLKLAEFFCEDPATFRLEECFKIFQTFCDKFKQAVKENERRQQLEEQASLRRKQREEQLSRQRARQINLCGTPVSDSENQFLDAPFDPRGSPALSRRRMGSFNSGGDISNSFVRLESNDGNSPDITPNGSLRRRRSRDLVEGEDLMEFLRSSSGHEHNSRERKAYGSLDRSWARRARSGSSSRKRPELLNIDFGADRERANSPAPIVYQDRKSPLAMQNGGTTTATTQSTNEDVKPRISREWRQKIETWLQSNENDEKQNEDYKRKRRLVNSNRRSLENDAESERKLGTLPEDKIVPTSTALPNNNTNNHNNNNNVESYKRVYPDWKPSKALEQTDVVGTIQAIADATSARDKAHWRRESHTNAKEPEDKRTTDDVNNSSYLPTSEELRHYRRQRSLENSEKHASQLQSIEEEDRRKSYIQQLGEREASDRLKVYIRVPNKSHEEAPPKSPNPNINVVKSPTKAEIPKTDEPIDAAPVARRVIAVPASAASKEGSNAAQHKDHNNVDPDAPGHFDRYSLTRRTRRYKRPIDYSSGNEEATKEPLESAKLQLSHSASEVSRIPTKCDEHPMTTSAAARAHLPERTITKLEKVGRHISSINQEDVREAIRNLKSPTGTPERIWSPPRDILNHQQTPPAPPNVKSTNEPTIIKVSNHEFNDEGFEETQSLVSDTPSHGKESTNSSCNEANELPQQSLKSATQKSTVTKPTGSRLAERLQISKLRAALPHKSQQPSGSAARRSVSTTQIERSRALRLPNGQLAQTPIGGSYSTRRGNLPRKLNNDTPTTQSVNASPSKRDVERSNSRNSLRSSRSSINSGMSVNTVRRVPLVVTKPAPLQTASVDSSPSKRPLTTQNNSPYYRAPNGAQYRANGPTGVPASRSSSSGSSVGPGVVVVRRISASNRPNLGSTSFKENQTHGNAPRANTARQAIVVKTSAAANGHSHVQPQRSNSKPRNGVSGFMRPTAASATKRNK